MNKSAVILIAEDDDGHFQLIQRNLLRSGLSNEIRRFRDGQEIYEFLIKSKEKTSESAVPYILILDIRMPKINGNDVLKMMKADEELRKIPVVILTTAGTNDEIDTCHENGCSMYVVKPIEYDNFVAAIQRIGAFLSIVEIPQLV